MPATLLCLLVTIFLDMCLFKRRDQKLFKNIFRISFFHVGAAFFPTLTVLIFSKDPGRDFSLLILLFVLPLYLLRRSRFVKLADRGPVRRCPALLSSTLGVVIVWMYGVMAFSLFVSGMMKLLPELISEMGDLILSTVFSSALIVALIYQSSRNFFSTDFWMNIGLRRGTQSPIKVILVPIILGLSFAFFASYLAVARHVQPQTPLSEVLETTQSVSLIIIFLFLAIGTAPLVEEIVFRGYFFRVLKECLGGKRAIYIIAMAFAVLHVGQYWGDWMAIGMVAILGFTLTILRAWTGTTIASVVLHYVYNGGVTIIPVVMMAIANPAYFEYKAYYPYHDAQTNEGLLKKSLARQPDLADAYNDLAWLYAQEGKNLNEALRLVDKALSYAPKHPAFLDTKAEVFDKLGRYEEAKAIRGQLKEK